MSDVADDSLPTLIHRDVLHANGLLASASVSLERLHLRGEGPGELVEGTLCAVLLRDGLHMSELAREGHGRVVNGGHLRREHCLHLILRLYAFDHCQQEIDPALVHITALCPNIGKLPEKPIQEIRIRRAESLHEKGLPDHGSG